MLRRVLPGSPLGEFADAGGLARAVAASFVGLELDTTTTPVAVLRAPGRIEKRDGADQHMTGR